MVIGVAVACSTVFYTYISHFQTPSGPKVAEKRGKGVDFVLLLSNLVVSQRLRFYMTSLILLFHYLTKAILIVEVPYFDGAVH